MGLIDIHLAPYVLKAMELRNEKRDDGGNAFRHSMATMDILLDYYHHDDEMDPVLLKAAILHDLLESYPDYDRDIIRNLDSDGPEVLRIVEILTCHSDSEEGKALYLESILHSGDIRAMKIKVADRLHNLTDLHDNVRSLKRIKDNLDETEKYIIPIASKVDLNMVRELETMIARRKKDYLVLSFWDKIKDLLERKGK